MKIELKLELLWHKNCGVSIGLLVLLLVIQGHRASKMVLRYE